MKGDDVRLMQQLLVTESCGTVDKSLISGTFDWWTEFVLKSFQDSRKPSLKSESGKYGPRTKAALETAPPDC
ncbi:peptidoglycan-binding domain-containing protein [Kitasatospora indigofera]